MATPFVSVHLPHFIGEGAEVPARVRSLASHYGDLVRFASQVEAGKVRATPIPCRRRPGRKGCGGLLVVEWKRSTTEVAWHCPVCGAAGAITGWQGTAVDLRAMRRRRRKGGREVAVTVEAFTALRDVAREDPELGRLAFSAQVGADGRPVLSVRKDELQRYLSRLAIEALRAAGPRATDLLLSIVDAIDESAAEGNLVPDMLELDAAEAIDFVQMLLDLPDARPPEYMPANTRRRPVRIRALPRPSPKTFQIKVSLRDVRPPIWRRLQVPSNISLPELHEVLQAAMGWHDCHLHLFRVGDDRYAPPGDWEPLGEDSRDVALVDLAAKKGARLVYEYDFGDGWTHDIVIESVLPEPCGRPQCTGGRRRCPPEDCGGPWGYAEFLEALADRSHERHDELREWYGDDFDPAEFDVDQANAAVQRMTGR
ncbi:MAG: plasmid pRiA4b ORF-3 family protein [Planctomycetota bacterium]